MGKVNPDGNRRVFARQRNSAKKETETLCFSLKIVDNPG